MKISLIKTKNMAQEILSIEHILESGLCPVGRQQLLKLIKNWEDKKNGELRDGIGYILAMNVGIGNKRARWAVAREEIEAWQERAKERILDRNR